MKIAPHFPLRVWDGLVPSREDVNVNRHADAFDSDRFREEIVALERYLLIEEPVLKFVSGPPSNSDGFDGQYALDKTNMVLYGPKTNGDWGSGTEIGGTGNGGADGRGFNPVGAWSSGGSYTLDDIATHDGQTFRAKTTHSGVSTAPASDTTNWELWAAKGAAGADGDDGADGTVFNHRGIWSFLYNYYIGDMVTQGGSTYLAIADNFNSYPPDLVDWVLFTQAGADGEDGEDGEDGADGDATAYSPGNASNWAGTAPTTIGEALDRCASLLQSLNSGTGP